MSNQKDKGFITWIFTIINLVIGFVAAISMMGLAIDGIINAFDGQGIAQAISCVIIMIVWFAFAWYWVKRSIMIILGRAANTWVYVAVSFFMSALIGGILMLIAKVLN